MLTFDLHTYIHTLNFNILLVNIEPKHKICVTTITVVSSKTFYLLGDPTLENVAETGRFGYTIKLSSV
jgi:hypothetical protein